METDIKERNAQIRGCVRLVFLFILCVMGLSSLLGSVTPSLPALPRMICTALVTVYILKKSRFAPEKGTLLQSNEPMTGIGFIVVLGAFMAAKLLSLIPSALLLRFFVNEDNASALQGISTVEDNILLSFLDMGIVTAICEETVFRACVGRTYKKYGIRFSMIMSTLLFAAYHCNLFQLFSTFLPGIVLFYVALNYSLKWSILLHFINNGVMSVGSVFLKKSFPDAFLANYGEYIIEILLVIAALCLMKKDNAAEKVRSFLSAPENEKGAYRAAMGNIWFVLIILAMALITGLMLLMLSGGVPSIPMAS